VLDTIDSFRAACDDYIAEDVATRGEWNLLGDAIRLGEYGRFSAQLGLGADPATAVALHGTRLAAERGTQEVGGARWALAALGFAVGKVPEAEVLARHAEMTAASPAAPSPAMPPPFAPAAPAPPTVTPPDRRPTLPAPGGAGGLSDPDAKARPSAPSRTKLLLGSVITVAVVGAAAGVGVWIASGDEDSSSSGDDPSSTVDTDRRSSGQEGAAESAESTEPSESVDSITDADRTEVLRFAEQASEALFARNYRDYDEDVSKALGFMTESFALEFQATTDDVRKEFIANRTIVEVRVAGSGTISVEPDVAYVLVFENQYVTRGSDDGSSTYTPYRVILTLARDGDGWLVDGVETDDDPHAAAESDPERAAILDAARHMVLAFLNLDYRTIEEDTAEVLALATGPFARQYQQSTPDLADLTVRSHAVQQGVVSAAGIVQYDGESATVIVATTGTVANDQTDGEPVARTYRISLDLEFVGGEWLTSDLQYVR